jgi:hypothetical protein
MPVVTAAKRRREFVRRRDIGIAIQHVTDLVRIFLVHARERQLRESLRRFRVESATGRIRRGGRRSSSLSRDSDQRDQEQNKNATRHFAANYCRCANVCRADE